MISCSIQAEEISKRRVAKKAKRVSFMRLCLGDNVSNLVL
jgi:hypothetical protein